ncbi:MAG: PilZ domain-containing protein [Acidobacteria bacterium]|nr:PilZ domain-containing protein [Acidobacteriota bacterium]
MGALPQLRRQSLRQPVHSLAYVNLNQGNGGVVLDLSETGVSLHAVKPLGRSHDPVNMEFHLLETGSHVPVQGEVVWADESGKAGIHFVGLSRFARRRLQEWMLYNALSAREAAEEVVHQPRPEPVAPFADEAGVTARTVRVGRLPKPELVREIPSAMDLPELRRLLVRTPVRRPHPAVTVLLASLLFAVLVLQVAPLPITWAMALLLGGVAPLSFWWLYRLAAQLGRWQ